MKNKQKLIVCIMGSKKGEFLTCKCGKQFYKFPSQKRKYCSLKCYWKYNEYKAWNKDKKLSKEHIEKLKIGHKKMWDEGKMSHRKKLLGNLNHSKNPLVKEKIRKTHEKNGIWTPLNQLNEWELYKRNVILKTIKNKLFESWNGHCFYCKKYILNEPKWSKFEPTVDHKISIFYGFHNKLKEEQIADINNIVISCRSCNCSKRENVR